MKSPEHIASLFEKYLSGSCTADELQSLLDHFEESNESDQLRLLIEKQMQQQINTKDAEKLQNALAKLDININTALNTRKQIVEKTIKYWPMKWISVAAAIATILFGAGLFYFSNSTSLDQTKTAYTNDISPGKVGATLTLANGEQIRLDTAANGEIANQAGISISKADDGQIIYEIKPAKGTQQNVDAINTLTTAKGETYMLTLPDKSKVWMNAASSLTYSANLNKNGNRIVKLDGEAYFEIEKDKNHPFVVESKGQQVEVLGTHFNINAYNDERNIKTTLLEGSVKVSGERNNIILQPGQQSILTGANQLVVTKVDLQEAVAWKNGEFLFRDDDFRTVMRKIARWYNIEVVYEASAPLHLELGGVTYRTRNISSVLKMMEKTGEVHFKIEGNKVTVSK